MRLLGEPLQFVEDQAEAAPTDEGTKDIDPVGCGDLLAKLAGQAGIEACSGQECGPRQGRVGTNRPRPVDSGSTASRRCSGSAQQPAIEPFGPQVLRPASAESRQHAGPEIGRSLSGDFRQTRRDEAFDVLRDGGGNLRGIKLIRLVSVFGTESLQETCDSPRDELVVQPQRQ